MMNLKKITALFLALVLSLAALLTLASCGEPEGEPCTSHIDLDGDGVCDTEGCGESVEQYPSGPLTYKVKIKDYFGNIPEGSFVLEVDTGEENTVKARINNGTASLTLDSGSYDFSINSDGRYVYDEETAKWTPASREAEIILYSPTSNGQSIQVVCASHTDPETDGDCRCDHCGLTLPTSHVNAEGDDCKCDVCDEVIAAFHKDEGLDCVCDACSAPYHPDLDRNLKCDGCGTALVSLDEMLEGRRPVATTGVSVGASIVSLTAGEMTYFIFTPTSGGIYRLSCITEGDCEIGYYGAPHFVQKENTVNVVDGAFTLTIPAGAVNDGVGGTSQYVIGVLSETAERGVFLIERKDDAPAETPFVDIRAESGAVKYDDPLNNQLIDIDITNEVTVIYNENDGYYHYLTADGPLVLVKISASGNSNLSEFALPSFTQIIETDRLCCYFYEGETVVRRESYNDMIKDYAALAGSRGLVPLDKTLADAIKNMGEHNGWWDKSGVGYIFGNNTVNAESAWLFACSYAVAGVYGSASSPIVITPESGKSYAVQLNEGESVSVKIGGASGATYTVTVTDASGTVTVFEGLDSYYDDNGDGSIILNASWADILQLLSTADATVTLTIESKT